MKRTRKAAPPYWLVAAEVICSSCDGRHARAVSLYCTACDRLLCPFCATHQHREVFCPECTWRKRSGKA
ncbi:MAG TPA: hypothetical protein VL284_09480 [Thermoanaerobaculia bacterium]|nr:hypothetical protein [Thermoanaerobaculia bacterium]